MSGKAIVLDANILVRAVLGSKVRELIYSNATVVRFYSPDVAFTDARKYLPVILKKRGLDVAPSISVLDCLEKIVQQVEPELYKNFEQQALQRISARDADDWPILATAMAIGCPIWTEDNDFFGTGIPTWTSNLVSLFFE